MPFSGLIGHAKIQEVLSRMIERQTLPHALLFVGPEAVGKTTVALQLVKHLLGSTTHPDFLTLERLVDEKTGKQKSQINVEQVRELNARLGLTSLSGGWKVVFIEEARALSMGAVNALLKTLEEPKGNVLFLLRAGGTEDLPATIVSRCQTLRFGIVPGSEIIERLLKMGFTKLDAQTAQAQSLGRPGRAIRFLKESSYQAQLTTGLNQAISFFSASLPERLRQVMELIPKTETEKDEVLSSLIDQWELVLRDVLLRQLGLRDLHVFSSDDSLDRLATMMTGQNLVSIFSRLQEVRAAVSSHINSHLSLEHIALA
ncbi:AAA family ATPase [Patescibacteria group bacterium]|nr:MAG: AAA family ATPase [Patescibacteria group bacterium]